MDSDQSEQWQEWLRSQTISSPHSPQQPIFPDYGAPGFDFPLQQGMGEFPHCLSLSDVQWLIASQACTSRPRLTIRARANGMRRLRSPQDNTPRQSARRHGARDAGARFRMNRGTTPRSMEKKPGEELTFPRRQDVKEWYLSQNP
jgi:hypothetical protein